MRDRVAEMMDHIFDQVQDEDEVILYRERITEGLLAAGYDTMEIRAAFSLLEGMRLGDGVEFTGWNRNGSYKRDSSNGKEMLYMSPEAFSLLQKLDHNGIIDSRVSDSILDLALQLPIDEISVGTVRTLAAIVLLLQHHGGCGEYLFDVPSAEEGELLH